MNKQEIKYLIGVYAAAISFLGLLVPVSIVADIVATFPTADINAIQMIVSLPSLIMVPAAFVVSVLASRISKKTIAVACTVLYMVAGLAPLVFHDSVEQMLVAAVFVGMGVGGLQNSIFSLIADTFDGVKRGTAMGLFATFVAVGGVLWTQLSSRLGAGNWVNAYWAYLIMLPLIACEIIFLPKGQLEPRRQKGERASIPGEILFIAATGFVFYVAVQLYNSNASLLVTGNGFGGTIESGYAATAATIAGLIAGLFVGPVVGKLGGHSITLTYFLGAAGLLICSFAPSLVTLCIGGFVASMGKEIFTPISGNRASEESPLVGRAFNIALVSAALNIGQAVSPYVTSITATPAGGSIFAKMIIGSVACLVIGAITFVHYQKRGKVAPAAEAE